MLAVGYFAAVKAGVAILYRVITGHWPAFSQIPWFVMLIAIPFSTPVQAGEEIGWRGYLLPRLSARIGLPAASIVVGIIWGCWHLPFFLVAGTDKSGQSFPAYVLGATALSVVMAWLYWRTRGSLLVTMVMHAPMPPMIIISGVEDAVTSDAGARKYCARVSQTGGRCELHSYEKLGHLLSRKLDRRAQQQGDFDDDPTATGDAESKVWSFLRSLGYFAR